MTIDNLNDGSSFSRTDNLWSPRLGLILKARDNLSIYSSYSRSYLPQSGDQFNSLAANTETLKPERFDNYEAGLKWEPIEGLLATAAVYQLVSPTQPIQRASSLPARSAAAESSSASNGASATIGRSPPAMPCRRQR
jgi:catecholate siderophore receptor